MQNTSGSFSYEELDGKNNEAAKILQAIGVSTGDSVGYVPYVNDVLTGALAV